MSSFWEGWTPRVTGDIVEQHNAADHGVKAPATAFP
jgi:hypothetical protein